MIRRDASGEVSGGIVATIIRIGSNGNARHAARVLELPAEPARGRFLRLPDGCERPTLSIDAEVPNVIQRCDSRPPGRGRTTTTIG